MISLFRRKSRFNQLIKEAVSTSSRSFSFQKSRLQWHQVFGVAFSVMDDRERDETLTEFVNIIRTNDRGIIYVTTRDVIINTGTLKISKMDTLFYVGVPSEIYAFSAKPVKNPLEDRPKVVDLDFWGRMYLSDGSIAKVLVAYRFPTNLNEGFLYAVRSLAKEIFIVWRKIPLGSAVGLIDSAKRRKTDIESTQVSKERAMLELLGDRIMSGEDLLTFHLIFIVKEKTLEELNRYTKDLKDTLKGFGIEVQEIPPIYNREVYNLDESVLFSFVGLVKRHTDTSSIKTWIPFISEQLIDPSGIFLGHSGTGGLVIFDVYSKPNYLITVLGESGSGKSMFAKVFIKRMKDKHDLLVVGIDPESEYTKVARYLGLEPIELKENQKLGLDPIKIMLSSDILTIGQLVDILSDYYAIPINLQGLLKSELFQWVDRRRDVDNIIDFVDKIKDARLRQYLIGATSPPDVYVYEGKMSNITSSVAFGMRDIRSKTLKALISSLLSAQIYSQLLTKVKKSLFFIDEMWLFTETPSLMNLINNLSKRGRKYGNCTLVITQRVEDVVKTEAGRSVLEQASTSLIFRHEPESLNVLKDVFNLNPSILEFISKAPVGVCLFKTAGQKLKLRVKPTEEELEMFSTTPVGR